MLQICIIKFIVGAVVLPVFFVAVEIVWYIIRLTWAWIDDDEIKGNPLLYLYWKYIRKGEAWSYERDLPEIWIGLIIILAFIPLLVWAILSFYFVTLIILVLVLLAIVARWIRRLTKRFDLHEKDVDAHK